MRLKGTMCYRVSAFCLPGMKISQELVLERPAAIPKTLPGVQVTLDLPCRLAPLGLTVRRGAGGGGTLLSDNTGRQVCWEALRGAGLVPALRLSPVPVEVGSPSPHTVLKNDLLF